MTRFLWYQIPACNQKKAPLSSIQFVSEEGYHSSKGKWHIDSSSEYAHRNLCMCHNPSLLLIISRGICCWGFFQGSLWWSINNAVPPSPQSFLRLCIISITLKRSLVGFAWGQYVQRSFFDLMFVGLSTIFRTLAIKKLSKVILHENTFWCSV